MSDWDSRLREASFKGVNFFIDRHDFETGRRAVQFEFPDRDIPYAEDLGARGRVFQIEGHLLGADYFQQRDSLISAFESEGPGELTHPYLGTKQAQCAGVSFSESITEGRIVSFTATFFEVGESKFPNAVKDNIAAVGSIADNLNSAAASTFQNIFKTVGFAQGTVDKARDRVTDSIDAFEEATFNVANLSDELNDFAFSIRLLRADVNALVASPSLLSSRFLDTIQLLASLGQSSNDNLELAGSLLPFGNDFAPIVTSTLSRTQQEFNQNSIRGLVQQIAIAESSRVVIATDFGSFSEALEKRNVIVDAIEIQMLETLDDTVFQALADMQAVLVEAVPDDTADLPRLLEFQLPGSLPSLVVSYNLFGNIGKEDDLISRNNIRNPGFIPALVDLQVLSE